MKTMRLSLMNRRRANTGTGFDLTLTVDAEIEIDGATGEVTVTVTAPAAYANYNAGNGAGIFIFNGDDLATGPVNLVPPQIIDDGTPASGETLTLTPGLWVYRPSNGGLGSPTYQWQADAAGNAVFANIGGATASSYTLTAGESGDDVRVQESLADNGGSRTATSAAVSVGAAAASAVATFLEIDDNPSVSGTQYTWTGKTLSDSGTKRIWLGIMLLKSTAFSGSGAPTIAGGASTFVSGEISAASQARILWYYRDVSATSGDIVFDRGETYDKGIAIVTFRSATTVTTPSGTGWKDNTASSTLNVTAGDQIIAAGCGYHTTSDVAAVTLTGMTHVTGSPLDTLDAVSNEASAVWGASHEVTANNASYTVGTDYIPDAAHAAARAIVLRP